MEFRLQPVLPDCELNWLVSLFFQLLREISDLKLRMEGLAPDSGVSGQTSV